jgi:hypothetical protein
MKGGGHLAILRSGFGATKESEMAAGDIVPVAGEMFEQTLASVGPDVLRAMVREFAQLMMDADIEVRRPHSGPGDIRGAAGRQHELNLDRPEHGEIIFALSNEPSTMP